MIEPTIGRVVLVYRPDARGDQYEPGLINGVTDNYRISVSCNTRDKGVLQLDNIPLYQDAIGDKHPGDAQIPHAFACWMPYQRKAAAGHEPNPFAGRNF